MKTLKLIICLLFLIASSTAQNSLVISNSEASPGEDTKLIIELNNTDAVSALQFRIKVPKNIKVKEKEAVVTSRKTDHVLYPKRKGGGEYLFICHSAKNESFTGNNGAIIEVPIKVPSTYEVGSTIAVDFVGDVIISSNKGDNIGSNHTGGEIKIVKGKRPDLAVKNVSFTESKLNPTGQVNVSWEVENVGELNAEGGWIDEVYLVSKVTNRRYIVGNVKYKKNLATTASAKQTATLDIPPVLGFDGDVKVEVKCVPKLKIEELDEAKNNNVALSDKTVVLSKKITLELNKNEVVKNAKDSIRVNVIRSGNVTNAETFQITSNNNQFFNLPLEVTLDAEQASNFSYVTLKTVDGYQGNQNITLTATGSNYPEEPIDFKLVESEKINLSVSYPDNPDTSIGSKITFTVNADYANSVDTSIALNSTHSERIKLPEQVVLKANEKSVTFEGEILDTGSIAKKEEVTIFAEAENYVIGKKELIVKTINIPNIELTLTTNVISEANGTKASKAILKRTTHIDKEVVVAISASQKGELFLPKDLVFEKGQEQINFNIGVVDNSDVQPNDRQVDILSHIKFTDCDCIDESDSSTVSKATITIQDDDDLALLMESTPTSMKAGTTGHALTIKRNVKDSENLKDPVSVSLSSNMPSVVNLPSTVTIPSNESSVTVTYATTVDTNLEGDQTVQIQAKATGYKDGITWILVTNQNKPDVIISSLNLDTQKDEEDKSLVNIEIKNQGYATFNEGSKLEYYISKTATIENLKPFASTILNTSIKAGAAYAFEDKVKLPLASGDVYFIAVINPNNSIEELDFENNQKQQQLNIPASYTVDITIDKTGATPFYKYGEKVIVSGEAKNVQGQSIANAFVEILIQNGEFIRTYNIQTTNDGTFRYEFEPLKNESGTYTVKATYPGETATKAIEFSILGFEMVNRPENIKWEPFVGFPLEEKFTLKNNTKVTLNNVKLEVPENVGFEITQTPIALNPGEEKELVFSITTDELSEGNEYAKPLIKIVSDEGAQLTEVVSYYSKSKTGHLVATPETINTTMVKDQARLYEFTVKNNSGAIAKNVEVYIPKLEWLRLKSPKIIQTIAAGEEAKVVLEFKPTANQQLNVPITGNLALKGTNTGALSVPFRIETVSKSTGTLVIDAVDEYTYNTASAPHLAGARVQIKRPFSNEIIAEGVTNEAGLFEAPDINEGWYKVEISRDEHVPYTNNIRVDPDRVKKETAFMPIQAVTYEWEVVRDEVTDEYEVKLVADFQTNVPKPVVIMELDNPELDLEEGETRMLNLTITNHGLIAAKDVKITAPVIEGYEVTPLIQTMDALSAKSTVVVPVVLKKLSTSIIYKDQKTLGSCSYAFTLEAVYPCNQDKKLFSMTIIGKRSCGSGELPDYPGRPGGGVVFKGGASPVKGLDLCDPCMKALILVPISCIPQLKAARCAVKLLTVKDEFGAALVVVECTVNFLPKCWHKIAYSISKCILDKLPISRVANAEGDQSKDFWENIDSDLKMIVSSDEAYRGRLSEYLANENIENDPEKLPVFYVEVAKFFDEEKPFSSTDIETLKTNLKDSGISVDYINSFTNRWNTTLEAWGKGVLSPNSDYPNIADKNKLNEYKQKPEELIKYTNNRGFASVEEMLDNIVEAIEVYSEEAAKDKPSVCATVKIEFEQTLTMTREAFKGTLVINNNSDKVLKDVDLELKVLDENGIDKIALFQINKEAFLSGTGVVEAQEKGSGVATFIPTKQAAPETKKTYSFGGVLSYFDAEIGEHVYVDLNPVTMDVSPSPDLILDYFIQRDIIADDALTENVVEPSIPAELSLMITNDGFGDAKNLQVESVQPKIIENEKGLLIDFEIIGSNYNGQPKELGLFNVDFGTLKGKQSSIGQWWFRSSLMGHFIRYQVDVKHLNSYGNKDLSLIKSAQVHELIKSVKHYGTNADEISDFLVNDKADFNDTPDAIYYSNTGTYDEVFVTENISASNIISASQLTTTVTVDPLTTGWNYGSIDDPGGKLYEIERVVRDDNVEIPIENFWQTFVTMRQGLNPKYENKLHVLDNITKTHAYTLHYTARNKNRPSVVTLLDAPEKSSGIPVETLKVKFNKEIDVNTFTAKNNIKLVSQGQTLPSESILIGKIDSTTYSVNIKELTKTTGLYELTVSSVGIKDMLGNEGEDAKRIEWLQFLDELGILKFESDQVKKQPINTVKVTFNKAIKSEEFTTDKVTINDKGVPNIIIQQEDDFNYSITNLTEYNTNNGNYSLAVDLPNITSVEGKKGLAIQSYEWKVDNNTPKVNEMVLSYQGSVHSQNVTEIDVALNKAIVSEFETSWVAITKNGQKIDVPITVQKQDSLRYKLLGLGAYTLENGSYYMTIDQSQFKDKNDNSGEGLAEQSWSVKREVLKDALVNLKITPDRGASNTDNITSGEDVTLEYETLKDNLTVSVYEVLGTERNLISKSLKATKGKYSFSLKGFYGAKQFMLVAYDVEGNKTEPKSLQAFIDFANITTTITPIKESEGDCFDFDKIEVEFSDAIREDSFTIDALDLYVSGIAIPKANVEITKLGDKSYMLSNISTMKDGEITVEIDKTKVVKSLSGLQGTGKDGKDIGVPSHIVAINGDETPKIGEEIVYTAPEDLDKYDWIILNGEILESTNNQVKVKWNKLGEQTLVLRYVTPLGCKTSALKHVEVKEVLGTDSIKSEGVKLAPIPNNGHFTIHTNKVLRNCSLSVFNVMGQLVFEENNVTISNKVKSVNISHMVSGTYILILHNQEEYFKFKIMIK